MAPTKPVTPSPSTSSSQKPSPSPPLWWHSTTHTRNRFYRPERFLLLWIWHHPLAFSYTVQAGDTAPDLNYKATSSLALNGGTIKDAAGNSATLTLPAVDGSDSLAGNSALVIDGSAPTISVAINDGGDGRLNAAEDGSVAIAGTTSGAEDGQTVSSISPPLLAAHPSTPPPPSTATTIPSQISISLLLATAR